MVDATAGKEIERAFPSSVLKPPLIRLHPALPWILCSFTSKAMKGCFSIPVGTASPFTSVMFHSPFKSVTFTSAAFFWSITTGRSEALQRAIVAFPIFLYPFTCPKVLNTFCSRVMSGQAIRVLPDAPRSIVPAFAFTSIDPIKRLHPV